jgi:hypothetical protein
MEKPRALKALKSARIPSPRRFPKPIAADQSVRSAAFDRRDPHGEGAPVFRLPGGTRPRNRFRSAMPGQEDEPPADTAASRRNKFNPAPRPCLPRGVRELPRHARQNFPERYKLSNKPIHSYGADALSENRSPSNEVLHVPGRDQAAEILKALPRIDGSEFVLTINGRHPIRGTHQVKRRIDALLPDMPPWVLHDIRRTVASGMARLGINLPVMEKLLNHVSGSFAGIVGVYQRHSFADEKRAAMQSWARHVEAIVSGETAANVVSMKA